MSKKSTPLTIELMLAVTGVCAIAAGLVVNRFDQIKSVLPAVAPIETVEPVPARAPVSSVEPTPAPVSSIEPTSAPVASTAPVYVVVSTLEDTYVSVRVDDAVVYEELMESGETQLWEGEEVIDIYAGNAGSLLISVNGEPAEPLGERDQIGQKIFAAD